METSTTQAQTTRNPWMGQRGPLISIGKPRAEFAVEETWVLFERGFREHRAVITKTHCPKLHKVHKSNHSIARFSFSPRSERSGSLFWKRSESGKHAPMQDIGVTTKRFEHGNSKVQNQTARNTWVGQIKSLDPLSAYYIPSSIRDDDFTMIGNLLAEWVNQRQMHAKDQGTGTRFQITPCSDHQTTPPKIP